MPRASKEELMVFAVYIPPHEPLPGQAFSSTPFKSSALNLPEVNSPTASNAETILRSLPL